jgi:AraC-like DNA-binding protein
VAGEGERRVAPVLMRALQDEFVRLDADPADLLTGLTSSAVELELPGSMILQGCATQFVRRALQRIGNAELGFQLGVRSKITHRGALALGLLASKTLGEAMALEMHFQRSAGYLMSVRDEPSERSHALVAEPRSGDHDIESFLVDELFTTAVALRRQVTAERYAPAGVEMVRTRPLDAQAFERFFGCRVAFGSLRNRLITDIRWLDCPLPLASVAAYRQALDILEREQASMSMASETSSSVELEILRLLPEVVSPAVLASLLHMSERSLRRRLADQDISYRQVLDACRKSRALELLLNGRRSVADVALQTGFANVGSFRRAFKRWTGSNPR